MDKEEENPDSYRGQSSTIVSNTIHISKYEAIRNRNRSFRGEGVKKAIEKDLNKKKENRLNKKREKQKIVMTTSRRSKKNEGRKRNYGEMVNKD